MRLRKRSRKPRANGQQSTLKALGIDHSDEFIKTLFVQFAPNRKLRQLYQTIRNAAQDFVRYELKPHLSLLYKTMPAAARRQLADSIKVPFSEVIFDSLKAVRCISPTRNGADVEAWRVVAAKSLGVAVPCQRAETTYLFNAGSDSH